VVDKVSKQIRSRIMANVKSSGNKSTELKFISLLKDNNITGWRRRYKLYGCPDIVFPRHRLAIFLDGCFWHGCTIHCRIPEDNTEYWKRKVENNIRRDKLVTSVLIDKKWVVMRIWEHELQNNVVERTIDRVKSKLNH